MIADNTYPRDLLEDVPPRWAARYERIAHLAHRLGRMPRRSDPGVETGDVAWVADQRRSAALTAPQRHLLFLLPGWAEGTRDGHWYERAEQLRLFFAHHGRRPRIRSCDDAERALGHWESRQRVAIRDGKMAPERAEAFAYVLRGVEDEECGAG